MSARFMRINLSMIFMVRHDKSFHRNAKMQIMVIHSDLEPPPSLQELREPVSPLP